MQRRTLGRTQETLPAIGLGANENLLGEAYQANVALVDEIEAVAAAKSCSPAQIALAWVLGRGSHVITIPGTTKLANLQANLGAYEIELSAEEQATLDQLADRVMGDRYDERGMSIIDA